MAAAWTGATVSTFDGSPEAGAASALGVSASSSFVSASGPVAVDGPAVSTGGDGSTSAVASADVSTLGAIRISPRTARFQAE